MTETNEERLDRIENDGGGLTDGDFEWLIGHVYHNQILQNSVRKSIEMNEFYLIENGDLQGENKRLREALEKVSNHESNQVIKNGQWALNDCGEIARQALEDER